jgi:hypothetical protein
MLSSICSSRRCILACVKFRSRALTALNLLPSIATLSLAEQLKAPAQHQKLTADLADRRTVVLAENRFEIQHAAGQDELDVALALPLKAPIGHD